MPYVDELPDAPDASPEMVEKYQKYCEFFKELHIQRPTEKQFRFVEHYLKTFDAAAAYKYAGYLELGKTNIHWANRAYWRVFMGSGIQHLLRICMFNWANERQITKQSQADRLLHIANTAEDVKDQLAALKELNKLLGYHKPLTRRNLTPRPARSRKTETSAQVDRP